MLQELLDKENKGEDLTSEEILIRNKALLQSIYPKETVKSHTFLPKVKWNTVPNDYSFAEVYRAWERGADTDKKNRFKTIN
jgi:hypothetical protein